MNSIKKEAAESIQYQRYAPQLEIDGVRAIRLEKHRSLEGWFMELYRLDGGRLQQLEPAFEARQVSISMVAPGRINAFHIHPKRIQDEVWCVVTGLLKIWLVDLRGESETTGRRYQHLLSAEEPSLLLIPSGVAHGYQAGPEGAALIYTMNDQFNALDPNEGRLPWDFFGADLWEENRG